MTDKIINALWVNASILIAGIGGFFAGIAYERKNKKEKRS